ncbi:subtilisin-like protease SBT3.3 isoform X2 [Aegilops tauschii subsp. strangulata]|uniref:subtilisin-like protease SBT3.3 isoform X2 n=1 Tax=Aegilops tauschii subsp. strangulata TaxID=200361 RepID=UPI003CC8C2B4
MLVLVPGCYIYTQGEAIEGTLSSKPDMDSRTAFCGALLLLVTLLPLSATASSKLYIVYMGEKKHDDPSVVIASHHDMLTSVFGSKDEAMRSIVYSYKHGFSGFAAMLTKSQAVAIAKIPEVVTVKPNIFHKMHTTRSWDFLGLEYNQPPQQPGLLERAKYGEDVIVGVIDSGIWPESRSFDDNGYGPVPARWKGKCQTGEEFNATSCNRKIIGARWYGRGISAESLKSDYKSPRDLSSHGTHVASTIAGREVQGVSYGGLGMGVAHGGAPRARLGIYKVCWVDEGCPDAAVLAAIDDAIHDRVDVLSLSVGGVGQEYSGTLHAVQRGISVVFAGGNDGPVPQTVTNAVPWVTTVAASMIDRSFPTLISLGNNEKLVGQSLNYNAAMNNSGFQDLVCPGSCEAESLALGNVTGKTVLCYAPAEASWWPPQISLPYAINHTIEAGAKGLIFAQYTANNLDSLTACEGFMPCALVDFEIAHRIFSYWDMADGEGVPGCKRCWKWGLVAKGRLVLVQRSKPIVPRHTQARHYCSWRQHLGGSARLLRVLFRDINGVPTCLRSDRDAQVGSPSVVTCHDQVGHRHHSIRDRSFWHANPSRSRLKETSRPLRLWWWTH